MNSKLDIVGHHESNCRPLEQTRDECSYARIISGSSIRSHRVCVPALGGSCVGVIVLTELTDKDLTIV
jgi:hypothetical protein